MISPSKNWFDADGNPVSSNRLVSYLKSHVSLGLRLYIGSDSMLSSCYCIFSTIVAVHSNDHDIANYFFQKQKRRDKKFKNLETKILKEVEYSLNAANYFSSLIPDAVIEVHIDIGDQERNATRHLVENSKGWVAGSGYISKIKPYAWASSVADWHTK